MKNCYIGVYWAARKQDQASCADQLQKFLNEIALIDVRLARWFRKGRSKKSKKEISSKHLEVELKSNRREVDGEVISDLGFGFGAWNGSTESPIVSIRAYLGSYNTLVGNSVVIDINGYDSMLRARLPEILQVAATCFDADSGLVTGDEWRSSNAEYSLEERPAFVRYVKEGQ